MSVLDGGQWRGVLQIRDANTVLVTARRGEDPSERPTRRVDLANHLQSRGAHQDLATGQALGERASRCSEVDRSCACYVQGRQRRPSPPSRPGDLGSRRFKGGGGARWFSGWGRTV